MEDNTEKTYLSRLDPLIFEARQKTAEFSDTIKVCNQLLSINGTDINSKHLLHLGTYLLNGKPKMIEHESQFKITIQQPSLLSIYNEERNKENKCSEDMVESFLDKYPYNNTEYLKRRFISRDPYKEMKAPNLQDDFYLTLIDWSSNNLVAIASDYKIKIWNASTDEIAYGEEQHAANTSVKWSPYGHYLAVAATTGQIDIIDSNTLESEKSYYAPATTPSASYANGRRDNTSRTGVMSWNNSLLATGRRDNQILIFNTRTPSRGPEFTLKKHNAEICGLQWSKDGQYLASGGNDNKINIWDSRMLSNNEPLWTITNHIAAVKAIAWCPYATNKIVTGGGFTDGKIRIWNISNKQCIGVVDTKSQLCGLHWSGDHNEIISAHGYGNSAINIWDDQCLNGIATIPNQGKRMLSMSASPDGSSIVTGCGDQKVRIYEIYQKKKRRRYNPEDINMKTVFR